MTHPTLIVISGLPGTGKTTLAHALARAVGCPAICRDEIKEGMVHATPGFEPSPRDELTQRTFPTFFGVLEVLLRAGVTTVAEAAFQDQAWRSGLKSLQSLARLRVVHCLVDPELARQRRERRSGNPVRRAHADSSPFGTFERLAIDAPVIEVDTTDDYTPGLDAIVAFVNRDTP